MTAFTIAAKTVRSKEFICPSLTVSFLRLFGMIRQIYKCLLTQFFALASQDRLGKYLWPLPNLRFCYGFSLMKYLYNE